MFTRHVTAKLKANSAAQFTRAIENDIIPLLRQQKGFRDEITLVAPERAEALSITFWETKEDAEAYHRTKYPEVLKTLSTVVEGTPKVETFEVITSTIHQLMASDPERHQRVARSAYQLHLERGEQSDALHNWLEAETTVSRSSGQAAAH